MSNLNDEQIFYSNLDRIVDGEVSEQDKEKLESLLKDSSKQEVLEKYKTAHGKLQNALEGQFLTEEQALKLRSHVLDMNELAAAEEEEIERLGAAHKLKVFTRNFILYGVIAFIGYQIAMSFLPQKMDKFDPLESFSYETFALEENLEERIDLRTNSLDDVKEFLKNYPNLELADATIAAPSNWDVEGASVIDYDFTKISVVAFTKVISGQMDTVREEREEFDENGEPLPIKTVEVKVPSRDILVQYSFKTEKDNFPKSEVFKEGNLEYYSYSSSKINMIMWKKGEIYNVLAGRISPLEMAKLAAK